MSIYAPLIHAYGMRRGLQDADAADMAQQVLKSIARAIPGFDYDPSRGSFRGWLFQIARNQVFKNLSKNARLPTATGETGFHQRLSQREDESDADAQAWNHEHEQQLFRWAAEKAEPEFKPTTWRAFWSVAVDGKSAKDVGVALGLTVGAVYIAKSRVTARLRELIENIED